MPLMNMRLTVPVFPDKDLNLSFDFRSNNCLLYQQTNYLLVTKTMLYRSAEFDNISIILENKF